MASRTIEAKQKENVLKAVDLLRSGTPIICFDTETTGLSPKLDRVISFSAIKAAQENGRFKILGQKDIYINPGRPITEVITNLTGIDDAKVKNCPQEDVAVHEIKEFLGERPFLCGYNSTRFDEPFMQQMYLRTLGEDFTPLYHIDVLPMAREMLELKSYKLAVVSHELGCDIGVEFHRSIDDVKATFNVFVMLTRQYLKQKTVYLHALFPVKLNYWEGKNHMLRRIYIDTKPFTKSYYDIYNKSWICQGDGFDIDLLRRNCLKAVGVNTDSEFVDFMRKNIMVTI